MTTSSATKPNSGRATRLGRAMAAVALSTLTVVLLASGAFASLSDTVDLLGFSAESNDSNGPPPPGSIDIAVGEGPCGTAILDPTATTVSFATSGVVDVGGIVDGTTTWTSTAVADICVKSEGTIPTTIYSALISMSSDELGGCVGTAVEEVAEFALGIADCEAEGELDDVVMIALDCANGSAFFHPAMEGVPTPAPGHWTTELQPGEMMDCSVSVQIDAWTNTTDEFIAALTDTLNFDLAITGEQL